MAETTYRYSAILIVKDDLHKSRDDAWARTLMEEGLSLLRTQMWELIAQHKLNSCGVR